MLVYSERIVASYNVEVYKELSIHQLGDNLFEVRVTEHCPVRPPWVREPSAFTLIDGVARWVSNGSILMMDVVRDNRIDRVPGFVESLHVSAYGDHLSSFLKAYRSMDPGMSDEELSEARAAHGPGVVLVNVVTGRRTQL